VEVIEILVKPGDPVALEQSLVTVESDKASMEIPSTAAGVVRELKVRLGDKVGEGSLLLLLEADASATAPSGGAVAAAGPATVAQAQAQVFAHRAAPGAGPAAGSTPDSTLEPPAAPVEPAPEAPPVITAPPPAPAARVHPVPADLHDSGHVVKPHASPSVRRFARELGVDLERVRGTGPKQRVTHDDVRAFVKDAVGRAAAQPATPQVPAADGAGLGLIPWPKVDFAKFGPIASKPLSRIRRISGANLHRNWVMIPHVTQCDDADVTELEAFRVRLNDEQGKSGTRVTMLAFIVKACVAALQRFPEFNASLDGDQLVFKQYWHVGFAADTPNGLVVPVIRDADRKGILQIAGDMADLSAKAREGRLSPADMQGGTFSISSLGGIGGTYFTPIINAPEVAILGVCRSAMRPVWNGSAFAPRLVLPLSLSYDHRVIDGAAAARFTAFLAQLLADFRRAML